jgi:hypothetical protein
VRSRHLKKLVDTTYTHEFLFDGMNLTNWVLITRHDERTTSIVESIFKAVSETLLYNYQNLLWPMNAEVASRF